MLARKCSKSLELGFISTWIENLHMYKLDLEKTEEPEIKLPTYSGRKSKKISEEHILLLHWLCKILWLCRLQQTGKFSEMEMPDHLTYLLRNLYAGQETTGRSGHRTTDWFKIGKGVCQDYILSPCLFNFYEENIMQNIRMEAQAESRLPGKILTTSDAQMIPL